MSGIKNEEVISPLNGFLALAMAVILLIGAVVVGFMASILFGIFMAIIAFVLFSGICVVNPNEAVVLQFFGKYYGTIYENGLFFVNPLTTGSRQSLKRQNFSSEKVRTNDKRGNPIDLGVIVAWQVENATFSHYNVEGELNEFIKEQVLGIFSEEAPKYYFDINDRDEKNKAEIVFRRNGNEIADKLKDILSRRVKSVGIRILDLNFNHCAYAKEIAQAMLQQQQAEAMLDARKTIVDGTYEMVNGLVDKFKNSKHVKMTDEDISALARNLMVVLVSDKEATPTINLN